MKIKFFSSRANKVKIILAIFVALLFTVALPLTSHASLTSTKGAFMLAEGDGGGGDGSGGGVAGSSNGGSADSGGDSGSNTGGTQPGSGQPANGGAPPGGGGGGGKSDGNAASYQQ